LASNLSHVTINPTSFSFTDGLNTYSSANPNVRGNLFQVSTDAAGNIILSGSDYIRITLWQTGSSPHAVGDRVASIDYNTGSLFATNNSPCPTVIADRCSYGTPTPDASTSQAFSYGPETWSRQSVAITLGGYLSGNWFNSAQPRHGFQLEFTNQPDGTVLSENEMVAIWFVYTPDGTGQQNWIYAQGPYDSTQNTVTLPATIFHGARFPFPLTNYNPADVKGSLGDWGSLTFTFTDCNNGTASWNSMVAGYGNGSIPITRLTSIQGTTCPH
jgi:hypothetical protein